MKNIIFIILFGTIIHAQTIITIGTISPHTLVKTKKFNKLAKYIQEQLNDENIIVRVKIAKDISSAIELIKNDKLNILFDSVYPTVFIKKHVNTSIEAIRWKKGHKGYRSIIFVKKQSSINSIKDLKNKSIAMEDEFSTSSYFIPKNMIKENNLELSKYLSNNKTVRCVFSQSEENTMLKVFYGKVDAGAIDDISFKNFSTNKFKIIYKSELIPRQLVSFSTTIDKKIKEKILEIFFDIHTKKDARDILKTISNTKKFTPITETELKQIQSYKL